MSADFKEFWEAYHSNQREVLFVDEHMGAILDSSHVVDRTVHITDSYFLRKKICACKQCSTLREAQYNFGTLDSVLHKWFDRIIEDTIQAERQNLDSFHTSTVGEWLSYFVFQLEDATKELKDGLEREDNRKRE